MGWGKKQIHSLTVCQNRQIVIVSCKHTGSRHVTKSANHGWPVIFTIQWKRVKKTLSHWRHANVRVGLNRHIISYLFKFQLLRALNFHDNFGTRPQGGWTLREIIGYKNKNYLNKQYLTVFVKTVRLLYDVNTQKYQLKLEAT